MIKKTITYTDYNGNERTEDFWFNLSQAEVLQMETSISGGWTELVKRITSKQDIPEIMNVFEDLIRRSYGEKSADGKRFIKNRELTEEFMQTEAYSNLYIELLTDADKASEFFTRVIPQVPEEDKDSKVKKAAIKAAEPADAE